MNKNGSKLVQDCGTGRSAFIKKSGKSGNVPKVCKCMNLEKNKRKNYQTKCNVIIK